MLGRVPRAPPRVLFSRNRFKALAAATSGPPRQAWVKGSSMASKARLVTLMPIRDMDRAIKFYAKALGGELLYRGEGDMKDSWASVKVAGQEVWLVTPSKREKRELAYSTFLVRNIKTFVAELTKNGVKFEKPERASKETRVEGPIAFEPFGAMCLFKDSEGNLLMAWQNNPPM